MAGRDGRSRRWRRAPNELTGNFGSAPEDTSISDYRFVALFAEKSLKVIFGVLQHYRREADVQNTDVRCRKTELAKHRDQHPSAILRADRPANAKAKEVKPMLASETRSGFCAMHHKATSQNRIKLVNDH
jgi:hypothetical protein